MIANAVKAAKQSDGIVIVAIYVKDVSFQIHPLALNIHDLLHVSLVYVSYREELLYGIRN